jgi:CheY-like chemotaxis protein
MHTDPKRLQQVIKNLLSNAFKFTSSGSVTFQARRAHSGWSTENESLNRVDQVLAFSVRDTGIGIPLDKQQIIFEAFQQADGSTSRQYGGTGLGLAISREIAVLLGGEIRLESVPGEGSTFTLYLPVTFVPRASRRSRQAAPVLAEGGGASPEGGTPDAMSFSGTGAPDDVPIHAAMPANGSGPESAGAFNGDETPLFVGDFRARFETATAVAQDGVRPDPDLAGKKVLVVDDDIRNVFALTSVLEETGMNVVSAETGQQALDVLEETPEMDFVLMDIMMPGMDGYETIRAIRTFAAFRPIPIIAVTAKAMPGDREKCLEAGASDYISKPVEPARLLTLLSHWITR